MRKAARPAGEAPLPVDPERLRRQFPALTDEDVEAYVTVTRRILSASAADRARLTRETLARARAAAAAFNFAHIASTVTSALPDRCPHRLGSTWSSS